MSTLTRNPYIGPRTYSPEEASLFFGRDRERRDLVGLILTEQIVLFYAQSGAGKSSLINTRLIPALIEEDYQVLPIGRVSGPREVPVENVYIHNLITSLAREKLDPALAGRLTLSQFLAGLDHTEQDATLKGEEPARLVLIVDQFEELFSTHAEHWQEREGFFRQLAEVIHDHPAISILLSMRQDYIALLDPYVPLLPNKLRVRYSMKQLERDKALEVVRLPAVQAGRPFAPGVAEKLVDDLSSIWILRPDGSSELQPGQYVEPSQVQVVCYSLWENLSPDGVAITEKDLMGVGDVNSSLGQFYAQRVSQVAQQWNIKERTLRDWFDQRLIAPGGIRNLIIQEATGSVGGLDVKIVRDLSDLVRAERRGGAVFYELTHDRLVEPILENNKRWWEKHSSPLQRQAYLWEEQGRSENWLLKDQALVEVEHWAAVNPDELTRMEESFLDASRRYQNGNALRAQTSSANRVRRSVAVIILLLLLALTAFYIGYFLGLSAAR